ncbi:Enhancer of mRNA-decapping protein 3 [Apiospora hydei]|uniref:Enhancer of mRNA-decapping protein 3 n=1 Tax=Apiospora hydei TaxID=1337664 RepID=A0ABR1X900_9PEZI
MADQFLGMRMTVILNEPKDLTLVGTIYSIVPNQLLALHQVHILNTGQHLPTLDLNPALIKDIRETPQQSYNEQPPPNTAHADVAAAPAPPKPSNASFQDPAIINIGRRPTSIRNDENRNPQPPNTSEKRDPPSIVSPRPARSSGPSPAKRPDTAVLETTPLARALNKLTIDANASNAAAGKSPAVGDDLDQNDTTEDDEALNATPTAPRLLMGKQLLRRQRRGGRNGNRKNDGDATPTSSAKPTEQGPGWRQTPILQSTKSFQPFASLKKSQKGRQPPNADNGWASEDVTDVQEAGDFDFEGSLAKFDKRTIFDEMRQQDKVDDAERLVSHNRLPRPKPGTAGGKNLHYTENVLDVPSTTPKLKETPDDFWKSEADDATVNGGEKQMSGREGSGRNSRMRGDSRMSNSRRSQSRKASTSAVQGMGGPSRGNSNVRQPADNLAYQVHFRTHSGIRRSANTEKQPPLPISGEGFYAVPLNRRIETVTHLQMLNLENIAHNEIGLSEDLMAENAGRSVAEVALTALDDPAIKLRSATASPPNAPTIVVLAGNNKSGIRAISAARHLRNRGVNVLVCVVGIEREKELIEEFRRQIRLFRNFGGAVCSKAQLFENLSKNATSLAASSQVSVTLIIDALLGLSITFEELRPSDQATTYELMEWANRNEAFVLAIDIPSGVDPTKGTVNVIDGAKLYVHPRYVVALGAPKQGLLKAVEIGQDDGDLMVEEWKFYLADIGLGASIWRKAATRLRRGIDFDDKWVLEMKYRTLEDLE